MKKSEIIDLFWEEKYFKNYRTPKEISKKIWEDYDTDAGNIIMTLKSKKYLKSFPKKGWRQIKSPEQKLLVKTDEIENIGKELGEKFEKEINELKIALANQPNCSAFLMRKILEKLLFRVLSKSDYKSHIQNHKRQNNGELPKLTTLLNWAQQAEIDNMHISTPRNLKNIKGSKFFGDTAAHNYLANVDFEDINPEMPNWRILIKELVGNL